MIDYGSQTVSIEDLERDAATYERTAADFPDHSRKAAKLRAKAQAKREEADYLTSCRKVG